MEQELRQELAQTAIELARANRKVSNLQSFVNTLASAVERKGHDIRNNNSIDIEKIIKLIPDTETKKGAKNDKGK